MRKCLNIDIKYKLIQHFRKVTIYFVFYLLVLNIVYMIYDSFFNIVQYVKRLTCNIHNNYLFSFV